MYSSSNLSRRQLLRIGAVSALGIAGADLLAACGGSSSAGSSIPASFSWERIPPYSLQSTDPKRVSYI